MIFARRFRDEPRCGHTRVWHRGDGARWRIEETRLGFGLCGRVCREEASRCDGAQKATLGRASTASTVERFAKADRAFAVTSETWDQDRFC